MSNAPSARTSYWMAGLTFALAVLSLGAAGLLAIRVDRVGEPAFAFLPWNLFLAWIPFVLSLCVGTYPVLLSGCEQSRLPSYPDRAGQKPRSE